MGVPAKAPCDEALIRSATETAPCSRPAEPWVLAATVLGSSMAFIDGTVVNIALPVLQSEFGASVASAQWVVVSYALFLAALLLPGGSFGDRHGRRRAFALGIALFTVASVWCGIAPSIGQLVMARSVQGIGAALLIPTSLAIIGVSFPPDRRGRAIGTWSALTAMTTALGPVLGGWLVQLASWRAVFFINLPLALVILVIVYRFVPESRSKQRVAPIDWLGAALAALGFGGVVYGLIESSRIGSVNPVILMSLVGGIVTLSLFLIAESRSKTPLVPLGLFRSPAFAGANILTFLLYGALYGVFFFLPFNLLQVQGYSASATGFAILPFSILIFLFSRWSGGIVDRVGARLPLVVGPILAAVGMGLLAVPGVGGAYWTTFFPAVAILGLGMAVTAAPLTTVVLDAVSRESAGIASAINNAVSRVAGLLAIALLGLVMTQEFARELAVQLNGVNPPPELLQELANAQAQLAAVEIRTEVGPTMMSAVRAGIAKSFVTGFRVVMITCSGLALLSALVASIFIRGREIPAGS